MARFRDIRRFVELTKRQNDSDSNDEELVGFAGEDDYLLKIDRDDAIEKYHKIFGVSETAAQEVYEDAVSKEYNYINIQSVGRYKHLWVGSKGRKLLKKTWIFNTGVWKEYSNENKDFLHLFLAFVSGVVIGVAGLIIGIIAL